MSMQEHLNKDSLSKKQYALFTLHWNTIIHSKTKTTVGNILSNLGKDPRSDCNLFNYCSLAILLLTGEVSIEALWNARMEYIEPNLKQKELYALKYAYFHGMYAYCRQSNNLTLDKETEGIKAEVIRTARPRIANDCEGFLLWNKYHTYCVANRTSFFELGEFYKGAFDYLTLLGLISLQETDLRKVKDDLGDMLTALCERKFP